MLPALLDISSHQSNNPKLLHFYQLVSFVICSHRTSILFVVSFLGTFFGAIFQTFTADSLGRKWSIVFWAAIFTIGVTIQTATEYALAQVSDIYDGVFRHFLRFYPSILATRRSIYCWIRCWSIEVSCFLSCFVDIILIVTEFSVL